MRAHGDGSLLSRLADQLVCLFGSLSVLVGDGRQVGLGNDVDSHGSTIWRLHPN